MTPSSSRARCTAWATSPTPLPRPLRLRAPVDERTDHGPLRRPSISASLSGESPWASLHVLILPLFNHEPLRCPIEDLNQLVRRHIQTVVSAAPGKAVATLENDAFELIATGMVTLDSRLAGVDDEQLIVHIVELWTFFWTQVLPYLEGALLPLQTDPLLSSLYRIPKAHRPTSPTQNGKSAGVPTAASGQIDVRALALVSFRDRIILPLFPRLHARLTMSKDGNMLGSETQQARLQQMLLVLVSQRAPLLASLSLTAPPPQPTAGEAAITRLLRALHAPLATIAPRHTRMTAASGAPSFLSAGLPRDRRGRIAQKAELGSPKGSGAGAGRARESRRWRMRMEADEDVYDRMGMGARAGGSGSGGGGGGGGGRYGPYASVGGDSYWEEAEADTPRVGVTFEDPGRERDKELLESLRSPDPESSTRMSMGGWGLGAGKEEHSADEEDEENMDWDEAQPDAQEMVEQLVGLGLKAEGGSGPGTAQQRRAQPPIEGYKTQTSSRETQTAPQLLPTTVTTQTTALELLMANSICARF
ncbi:HbrB-like-domain-containing protein [Cerioporus squamosus]|nr:HbrB-like-domain-containing protein [Cerioporus squamosus]